MKRPSGRTGRGNPGFLDYRFHCVECGEEWWARWYVTLAMWRVEGHAQLGRPLCPHCGSKDNPQILDKVAVPEYR